MLERASTCFESCSRQLLRAPRRCLRTRRMLHSSFWHHGASDLSLPIWWAAPPTTTGEGGDGDDRLGRTTPSAPHEALLDFLYPAKTLALLKKLSALQRDAIPRRRLLRPPPARSYTTGLAQRAERPAEARAASRAQENLARAADISPTAKRLVTLLEENKPKQQEEAWQLYTAIPTAELEDERAVHLQVALLEYLSQTDDNNVSSRALRLYDEIPREHLTPLAYRAVVAAHVSLRMAGQALQLLEDNSLDFDLRDIGMDIVLKRTVADEQWDLCLRLFGLFLERTPYIGRLPTRFYIRYGNSMPEVWQGVASLPLLHIQTSFFKHLATFKHELGSSSENKQTLSLFTIGLVSQMIDQIVRPRDLDEVRVTRSLRRLLKDLRQSTVSVPTCWEHAVMELLKLPRNTGPRVPELINSLYEEHRQMCLDSQAGVDPIRRSISLMRNMIVYYGDGGNLKEVEALLVEMRTVYPKVPLRLGLLRYLIHMFATHGKAKQVRSLFEELKASYPDDIDLELVSALPYAHARRADVEGAIAQFNLIHDDFGMDPDLACWNILLLSYVRAEDLEGAIECFNTCIDNGFKPDEYTFAPLLDICAGRGDVEAFEALFTRAEQMGVQLAHDVRARSRYVQVFLNSGDAEGAYAIAQGMLRSWQAGSLRGWPLTHTWNLLIQHCALDCDLVGAQQLYKEMVENDIPMDSWTYGSLMRALIEVKQTNAAFKLLSKTMPANKIPVHALHYAIVMTGFLREGGKTQTDLAISAYEHMQAHGVIQTEGSLQSTMRTLAALDKRRLYRAQKPLDHRLKSVETVIEGVILEAIQGGLRAHGEPRHSREVDSRNYGGSVQAAYGLIISLYANRSYKQSLKFIKRAEEATPDGVNYTGPLTLITGTMEAHLKAGQWDKVARGWELARRIASRLDKTVSQLHVSPSAIDVGSLLDPAVLERHSQAAIAPNRRNILYRASRLYMRSLLDPKNSNPTALQKAQRTMRDLIVNGYSLDTLTWNEFVAALASRGRVVDAFQICEKFLMPAFPGWRELNPNYVRKDRVGYQWMELRHYEIRKNKLLPRYGMLVVLAQAMRRVREDERMGVGYDEKEEAWMREVVERVAPMTLRAIETMPRTGDPLQERLLLG